MSRKNFTYPVSSIAGSTGGNIIKLLKSHKVEPKYYLKFILSFLIAIIFSLFNLVEHLFWRRRIKDFHLEEPPLFVIGFNRSGTTLLHNLLCQDPKAGFTSTLHTIFPYCVLTQKWWLTPLFNFIVPDKRPFDNVSMNMNFPQEEEFALANLQPFSVYNFFLFPTEFDHFVDYDYFPANLTAKQLDKWKIAYRRLVVKSLLNTNGKRYISKNPQNISKVSILKELYPGSGFIFIYRNPYVVVESFYNFILAIFPSIQLQDVPADFSRKNIARFYAIAMNNYLEMKKILSPSKLYEVKMEDFVKDKIESLRAIYKTFGLKEFDKTVPAFEAFLANNPNAHKEAYGIHEDTIRYVNLYASDIVVQFGYSLRN